MNDATRHIVLAGFGNMGRALAQGWVASGVPGRITVVDPEQPARDRAAELGLTAVPACADVEGSIDVAVLAVKPARLDTVVAALPARLYLSIAAGRSIADIEAAAGGPAGVIRCMPNTPAAIGLGVSVMCANAAVSDADRIAAGALMAAAGQVEWVADEAMMDAVTAVSGSGPAYVFLLIECLTDAAVDAGLEPGLAERLAVATVRGAGAYAAAAGQDAASLRRQVTSPNGTTAAALQVLRHDDALLELIRAAVRAAAARSRELGNGA